MRRTWLLSMEPNASLTCLLVTATTRCRIVNLSGFNWSHHIQCTRRIIPGFDSSFLCKKTWMGFNEELNWMILFHLAVTFKEAWTRGQGPPWIGQSTCWKNYVEINPTRNELVTGILCALTFKTVWEIIWCCLTSKGHKEFGLADLRIL